MLDKIKTFYLACVDWVDGHPHKATILIGLLVAFGVWAYAT